MKESSWVGCKNILIIRADNMGDLLMSSPAIRAVKETLNCKISVLTSSMGSGIASFIPEIDQVITADLPWIKNTSDFLPEDYYELVETLKKSNFDGVIIFTVYSQNPMPSAMLAYLAKIPKSLSYCRENPYQLLTDWVPEKEPYTFVRHQVRRDLDLVANINCLTSNERLSLNIDKKKYWPTLREKLQGMGIQDDKSWIIMHAGVSEEKRQYPLDDWVEAGNLILKELPCRLLLTGSHTESDISNELSSRIGDNSFSLAGQLSLGEFITLISESALVISVNTGTIHIAAALNIPMVVLYALTNPQHAPWKVKGEVLPFNVPDNLKSKNEVIKYVNDNLFDISVSFPTPADILDAVCRIVKQSNADLIPEIILSGLVETQRIGKFSWLPADRAL